MLRCTRKLAHRCSGQPTHTPGHPSAHGRNHSTTPPPLSNSHFVLCLPSNCLHTHTHTLSTAPNTHATCQGRGGRVRQGNTHNAGTDKYSREQQPGWQVPAQFSVWTQSLGLDRKKHTHAESCRLPGAKEPSTLSCAQVLIDTHSANGWGCKAG